MGKQHLLPGVAQITNEETACEALDGGSPAGGRAGGGSSVRPGPAKGSAGGAEERPLLPLRGSASAGGWDDAHPGRRTRPVPPALAELRDHSLEHRRNAAAVPACCLSDP